MLITCRYKTKPKPIDVSLMERVEALVSDGVPFNKAVRDTARGSGISSSTIFKWFRMRKQ